MFKHYFEQIEGVEIWPIISLILFFVVFIFTVIWILMLDKKYIQKMKGLPFEDDADVTETEIKEFKK